ncbi:MAG TPA: LCP family protein [Candidatus Omnitrophota bacterium]|nr:LCP family protein [Candidatus Omnitrophota bacterium]
MKRRIDILRLLAVLVVVMGVVYFHLNVFLPKLIPNFLKAGVIERPMNILVLGLDINYNPITKKPIFDDGRSDTMILIHYDPIKGVINVLSIPRDSYVDIPGYYPTKINAAYAFGRIDLTKQTVENLTGVHVDKYLIADPRGLVKLIDLLGGITVDVEKDLYYTDRAAGLYINLKKGRQKLNGTQAEGYIRFRHDAIGDIGRIGRQQNFLKEMTRSLATPNALLKSPFIVGIFERHVRTDLTLKEFILLGNTLRSLDLKEINTASVPGEPADNQAGSVWMVDYPEMRKIISQYF